jgi:hypothetical protein
MTSILAFGDSLTWGYFGRQSKRHSCEGLWPSVQRVILRPSFQVISAIFIFLSSTPSFASPQYAKLGEYAANIDVLTRVCTEHVQVDQAKLAAFKERWLKLAQSPEGEEATIAYGMTMQLLKTYFRINRKEKFKQGCENTAKAVIFGLGKESPVMIDNLPPELQEKLK